MDFHAWTSVVVLALIFAGMASGRLATDLTMLLGLGVLMATGTITPAEATAGFAHPTLAAIALLFVVSAGVKQTGLGLYIADRALGQPKSDRGALARVLPATAGLSAFMNNTPLVAMLAPSLEEWARKRAIPPSRLLMPLSFAAILGGTCSLIGTSTNLVVVNALNTYVGDLQAAGAPPETLEPLRLGMFSIGAVGLPAAIIGCLYMYVFAPRLLPDRRAALATIDDPKEYTVEMLVPQHSPLAGQTIEEAGLRRLAGLFLAEIERAGELMTAVGPEQRLAEGDRLVFVGIVDSVADLQKTRGLVPATDQVFKLDAPRSERCLIEAVISARNPNAGKTIRAGRFRSNYEAAVIAVAREGQRIAKKIGDIVLRPGDALLVEAHPSFEQRYRNNRDFLLVRRLEGSDLPRHEKAGAALAVLCGMVGIVALNEKLLLPAALSAAGLMIVLRCCTTETARSAVDWELLVTIAGAFGVAAALEKSGAAEAIANGLIGWCGDRPYVALAVVYLVTLITTEIITNTVAAALMFPLAIQTALALEVNPMPFVIGVMMAASAAFATPFGYQTNLMVYGLGGYRFRDYVRFGGPLDLIVGAVVVAITPWIWKF